VTATEAQQRVNLLELERRWLRREEETMTDRAREVIRRIHAINAAIEELQPYRADLRALWGGAVWVDDETARRLEADRGPAGVAWALDGNIENRD
jgi:hypothetical protein